MAANSGRVGRRVVEAGSPFDEPQRPNMGWDEVGPKAEKTASNADSKPIIIG